MSAVVDVATIVGGLVAGWWLGGKLCQLYTRRQHRDGLTPDEVAAIARQVRDELRLEAIVDKLASDPRSTYVDSIITQHISLIRMGHPVGRTSLWTAVHEHCVQAQTVWEHDIDPAYLDIAAKAEPC